MISSCSIFTISLWCTNCSTTAGAASRCLYLLDVVIIIATGFLSLFFHTRLWCRLEIRVTFSECSSIRIQVLDSISLCQKLSARHKLGCGIRNGLALSGDSISACRLVLNFWLYISLLRLSLLLLNCIFFSSNGP